MDYRVILTESLVIIILGTLLHFTYEWFHKNKFVGIFAAVNESTWEHIKLVLSGIFACTLVDVWILGDNPNYWLARSVSMLVPVVVIPALFYGYRKVMKVNSFLPIDIGIFILTSILSTIVFATILAMPKMGAANQIVSIIIGVVVLSAYLLLTRFPLHHAWFKDPLNGRYGYAGSAHHHERKQIRKVNREQAKAKRKNLNKNLRKVIPAKSRKKK